MHKLWLVVIVVKEYLYQEFHFYLPKMKIILFFFFFKMTQFPIQLNFTMTINKAQGQTLNYVRIYLPTNILSKTTFFSFSFLRKVIDNFMQRYLEQKLQLSSKAKIW